MKQSLPIILAFALLIFALASCSRNARYDYDESAAACEESTYNGTFALSNAGSLARSRGFIMEAEVNNRRYFFPSNNEPVNRNFVC